MRSKSGNIKGWTPEGYIKNKYKWLPIGREWGINKMKVETKLFSVCLVILF